MKELTSFEFVHAIATHSGETQTCEIQAFQVFRLTDELEAHNVKCLLGAGSFMDLQERFPDDVIVTRRSVELKNLPELRRRLDIMLKYFQDEELDQIVWETWQKRRNEY